MVKKVIAFLGFQGSGKDYKCKQLEMQGYRRVAFADALREVAFSMLNIPFNEGMRKYDELKKTELINGFTFRNILEHLGSGIRKYDKDFWVKTILKDIKNSTENICISDMRYVNEYKIISEFCKENNIEFHAYLSDYHSDRYDSNNTHVSAQLASYLVKDLHLQDLQEVTEDMIRNFTMQ